MSRFLSYDDVDTRLAWALFWHAIRQMYRRPRGDCSCCRQPVDRRHIWQVFKRQRERLRGATDEHVAAVMDEFIGDWIAFPDGRKARLKEGVLVPA